MIVGIALLGCIVFLAVVWGFMLACDTHDEHMAYHTRQQWYANQMYLKNRTQGRIE